MRDNKTAYEVIFHNHQNHIHYELKNDDSHNHVHDSGCDDCEESDEHGHNQIGKNDEGCPCCAAAIDLDEVATALNEISKNSSKLDNHSNSYGEMADFSSAAHWGIFLGIAGPLALIGMTAAIRNIKGTLNNKEKLDAVIKGLEQDIENLKNSRDSSSSDKDRENYSGVIQRLEAFEETLKNSEFDTKFNLVVPGVINGAASTAVLSSAVVASPWALPVIALYAGCQTARNGYDLWRTWNEILPEETREEVELNMNVGIRKINQITDSKRKFYATNTLGFAAFTAGAAITTVSALSVVGAPGLIVGIPLLAAGAVSTGITNNIWTNKFKPRNGELGVDRAMLDLESVAQEIGERREVKKILKNYRDKHLPSESTRRFGYSLLASLPFRNEKGANLLHNLNQSRVADSDSKDEDRLDLLERAINAKIVLKETKNHSGLEKSLKAISNLEVINYGGIEALSLKSFDRDKSVCAEILLGCKELGIDNKVLEKFIKNSVIKSSDEHDKSIKNEEDYLNKLKESGLFTIEGKKIILNLEALELKENKKYRKEFMNSFEEYLLFDYVEKLKYEQYGLNDFYWALDKQNKKQPLITIDAPVEEKKLQQNQEQVFDQRSASNAVEESKGSFADLSAVVEEKPQQNKKEASALSSADEKAGKHVHSDSCSHPVSFMGNYSVNKDGKLERSRKRQNPSPNAIGREPGEKISSRPFASGDASRSTSELGSL